MFDFVRNRLYFYLLSAAFLVGSALFVWRSFYAMRIPDEDLNSEGAEENLISSKATTGISNHPREKVTI